MSKQSVITAVKTLVLGWTPNDATLSQLTKGYAYPYDTTPDPIVSFPAVIVERDRAKPAYSDALGSGCRQELLPVRVDILWKVWDHDKANINTDDEAKALAWEDELHSLFASDPTLGGAIMKMGPLGAPRRIETRVGYRFWFDQELFGTAAFFDAFYEVA